MGVFVLAEQPLLAYMSVDLRGLQACMPQQLLNSSQVGSAIEQMRGEAVPEGMGMGWRRRPPVEHTPHVARP